MPRSIRSVIEADRSDRLDHQPTHGARSGYRSRMISRVVVASCGDRRTAQVKSYGAPTGGPLTCRAHPPPPRDLTGSTRPPAARPGMDAEGVAHRYDCHSGTTRSALRMFAADRSPRDRSFGPPRPWPICAARARLGGRGAHGDRTSRHRSPTPAVVARTALRRPHRVSSPHVSWRGRRRGVSATAPAMPTRRDRRFEPMLMHGCHAGPERHRSRSLLRAR